MNEIPAAGVDYYRLLLINVNSAVKAEKQLYYEI